MKTEGGGRILSSILIPPTSVLGLYGHPEGPHWPVIARVRSRLEIIFQVPPSVRGDAKLGGSSEPPADRRVADQLAVLGVEHELGIGPHLLSDDGAVGALVPLLASAAGRLGGTTDIQPILGA